MPIAFCYAASMFERAERIANVIYGVTAACLVVGTAALCLTNLPILGAVLVFAAAVVLLGLLLNLATPLFAAAGLLAATLLAAAAKLSRRPARGA